MNPIHEDILFIFHLSGIFIFSMVMYALFSYFALSFGVRDFQKAEINRWNTHHKPSVGGFVFYIIFLFIMIIASLNADFPSYQKINILGIWSTATIAFLVGFADDTFNTQPIIKSSSQLACALILIFTKNHINIFDHQILNYFMTIFWVVGIMNSINMLDNMDGIAGSISAYILLFVLIIMYHLNIKILSLDFLIASGITASLVSFLFFNFYPSKIFMGDTGSQFLGLILSYFGIKYLWNLPINIHSIHPLLFRFVFIALVYIILITDTTTVTINRLMSGGSPFIGGKDHTTHFLCKRGLSERKVFYIFLITSFVSLYLAYHLLFNFSLPLFYSSILFIALTSLSLYFNTKLFWPEKK